MDLCLHLVRLDHGPAIANTVARRLVVPPHRAGGQAQFVTAPVPAQDDHPLTGLLPWIVERLDRPLTVEDLARQARMSSRHLGRHFRAATGTTPLQWLLTQRIRRAQELLEATDDSVEAIATATGMGTATTLRRRLPSHGRRAPGRVPPHLPLAVPPRRARPRSRYASGGAVGGRSERVRWSRAAPLTGDVPVRVPTNAWARTVAVPILESSRSSPVALPMTASRTA